ncbi:MAG: hypothetical protein A2509_03225 [Candidatus Edwardsbacteria bacterium RIFOXYD12_FULL_50_11]|jgi:hypothetical protein|uniref:Uncharacterized protein n=1 Tax=Candidatus Edwardsbacteria bacterium GWF2_54_11 TaxID=1817851 RepID=A0A1F5RHW1_9BACT|nr:MAG: hypothetical protein A2502_07085 [Candidatus Edwardsbacteria bacterium RifOxyC12_full_54_24]OGF14009.1 MAG: hypothetical protein A2024_05600 [Candidatus Edwardsbacteria bacterium GWF2_54_11]OGF16039.1 MAG: hypothetical protein A2509_03225 [Candidatus Edwardsbacteria bacterium RIFOXYD12_FULL_50_11]OGJ17587.1 MAG: hypothetical protein A2349_04240 [Candidatus Edwardsbacteria bacterium RifOxyB12_full_52_30]OGT06087.1 MAG: hypothetical protein A2X78_04975 [Gammaproteobacteria bacterium GWE2_
MNYKPFLLLVISFVLLGCGKNVLNVRVSTSRGPYAYTEIIMDGSTFAKKYGGFTETYDSPQAGKYWLNCYDYDDNAKDYIFIGQSNAVEVEDPPLFSTKNYDLYYSF